MKWTVTGPDGQQYRGVEAGSADEAKRIVQERQPRGVGAVGHSGNQTQQAPQDFGSTPLNLAAGFGQGLLDPLEGGAQLLEHTPVIGGAVRAMIPDALRNWAKDYQSRVGASTAGRIGEFAGNVGPMFLMPETGIAEAARAVPYLGRVLPFLSRTTLPAVLEPVPPQQPTVNPLTHKTEQPSDFWTQKGEQAAIGTALGGLLEGGAGLLGRIGRSARAPEEAARAAQQETERAQQAADQLSGQQQWRRSAQALTREAAKAEQAGEQKARETAIATKRTLPGETTSEWWRRTLAQIGHADPAAIHPVPESGSKVRKIVGDRMNELTDRMTLDPHDPSFVEAINNERDRVLSELTPSERAGWFTKGQPLSDVESAIKLDMEGKVPARVTKRDPTRATGDFATIVMEPLEKGPLTGKALTEYNTRLGDKAEQYVRQAQSKPKAEADELYDRSRALRRIQDAVLGHAAGGNADDKLAMESARRAYRMWAIGNDAARAANRGIATPRQLTAALARRLGKGEAGEARLKDAIANASHPDHDAAVWLQRQLERHQAEPPKVRPDKALPSKVTVTPRTQRVPGTPPTPGERGVSLPEQLVGHAVLSHIPGNHMLPWGTRHGIARTIGGFLGNAVRPVTRRATGNVTRRFEAPTSAAAANIKKQNEEPITMTAPSSFAPPR